ncbi:MULTISPECIES: hypothetical protein [Wolbachia]|uniref:hypothetical protein n=1 Tax=Wolbachia TaxID=953 RepID=UPI0003B2B080|nr:MULTISPECIES: hypothetical protein [Wolbachia]ERN55557.1 hypothetical protein WMELPOP_03847 [Wolbachia pipientis wMelPop]MDU8909239.1 hypothetical protein [Wolbachia endosymbiont of Drosophila bocqueti]MDU8923049.1 hypothetical protein [Wolbachia endosymbiont of Drosophila seguyi]MDX5527236.1 hypothetical protein [Wolbachia endosymbiont of Andrena nigroaenea]MDX5527886.1 hypothetical protein [Wolbachia endosymbiont of Andrena minutula]
MLDTGIQEFGLGTKLVSIKVADLMLKHNVLDEITARLDSSVKHWNDTICCAVYL